MNTPSPAEEQEKVDRALSALEGMADVWAAEVKLNEVIDNIVSPMHLNPNAPTDVREGFAKRMREQIDAFVLQSFIEGAYRAHCNATDALTTRIAELEGQVAAMADVCIKLREARNNGGDHCGSIFNELEAVVRVVKNIPTSAQAHLAELRNAALEEAAKIVERRGRFWHAIDPDAMAAELRALKSTQEPTP